MEKLHIAMRSISLKYLPCTLNKRWLIILIAAYRMCLPEGTAVDASGLDEQNNTISTVQCPIYLDQEAWIVSTVNRSLWRADIAGLAAGLDSLREAILESRTQGSDTPKQSGESTPPALHHRTIRG